MNNLTIEDKEILTNLVCSLFEITNLKEKVNKDLNTCFDSILSKNEELTLENLFNEINNINNELLKSKLFEFNNSNKTKQNSYYAKYFN